MTLGLCSVDECPNSKTKLYGEECIQDARDPFVLPGYRVGSIMAGMSEHAQTDRER